MGRRNKPPVVAPTAIPTSGPVPLAVQFAAHASDPDGSIVSYAWNFGDGSTGITANPLHTYANAGNYHATVTVTDNRGTRASGSVGVSVSSQTPTTSIQQLIDQAQPGDIIELADGIYEGAWGGGLMDFYGKHCTAALPIVMRPAAGATVIIRPAAPTYRAIYFDNCSWIRLEDLIIDGTNLTGEAVKCTDVSGGATDITLLRCEIRNATSMGVLTSGDLTARLTLQSCWLHDNGTNTELDHNVYLATAGNIVSDCEINAAAAYGIHLYGGSTMNSNVFRNNYVHHNGGPGIGVFGGTGNLVYNNVVASNGNLGIRIRSYAPINNCGIYNNTVSSNGNIGIQVENISPPTIANVHVRNNIAWNNGFDNIITNGVSGTISNNLTSDPLFMSTTDFHVQAGSAAIDTGMSISGFDTDKDGVLRPQGAAWDIGAYEQ